MQPDAIRMQATGLEMVPLCARGASLSGLRPGTG